MNDYQLKLDKLPQDIRAIYSAVKGVEVNIDFKKKYNFSDEQLAAYLDIVAGLFFKEINLIDLVKKITIDLKLDEATAKKLALDIVGYRLLPADAYFAGAANKYLSDNNVNLDIYNKAKADYLVAVKKEEEEYAAEMAEEAPYEMPAPKEDSELVFDPIKEKQDAEEMFKEALIPVINVEDQNFLQQLNTVLLKLIVDDNFFRKNIEQSLYKNQEVLTRKPFIADNEDVTATVARWLKDFIAKNGSDIFSNIVLAKYLTSSENAKILDPEERNLLKKLLKLYRNLVFFPDSMKDIPIEEWELFPINRDQVEKVFHPTKLSMPDVSLEAPSVEISQAESAEATAAAKKILEELENGQTKIMPKEESPEIKSLRAMAEQYPLGSLERRAIESEIKKKL